MISSRFVVDASVSLRRSSKSRSPPYTEAVPERLAEGDRVLAPVQWPLEMNNGFVLAEPFKKLRTNELEQFLAHLKALPVEIDIAGVSRSHTPNPELAPKHQLSA